MPKISVYDESVAGSKSDALDLEFASGKITLRELIASRVEEEVRRFNAQNTEFFRGLVQPSDSEALLNGYKLKTHRHIEPQKQIEQALHAFGRNGFFVLVNDRQIEDLDDEIEIGLDTQVSFIKLIALVGG